MRSSLPFVDRRFRPAQHIWPARVQLRNFPRRAGQRGSSSRDATPDLRNFLPPKRPHRLLGFSDSAGARRRKRGCRHPLGSWRGDVRTCGNALLSCGNPIPRSFDETCGKRPAFPETIAENIFPARECALLADASLQNLVRSGASRCCARRRFGWLPPPTPGSSSRGNGLSRSTQRTMPCHPSDKSPSRPTALTGPTEDPRVSRRHLHRAECRQENRRAAELSRPLRRCRNRGRMGPSQRILGQDYVSLSLSDPSFGPKKLYCNLGRAAGQDDDDLLAIIWIPAN